jgi:methylmalonyl-CoA mutase N-terminal domain/subunit
MRRHSNEASSPSAATERRAAQTPRKFRTSSGIEIPPVWPRREATGEADVEKLGTPGAYPFTRGIYPEMYRRQLWTMRQYSGFGTAEETNRRFRYLLEQGVTGLSVAFDLPTQMGYDSDDPMARGEVGRTGVAIDTIEDMETLFEGIPLERVSISMTINATAAILLGLLVVTAERRGIDLSVLSGTVQNDLLKEYIARGTYIFPPKPSLRLTADIFRYCHERVPRWNTISISGYHIREAGSTAVQEIAFTFANAKEYLRAGLAAGLALDEFAPRLSFFFNVHSDFFEEIAKFRAARRLWARIMQEEFGAKDPRSWMLRFHAQTAGSTLTAQEPLNNVPRTTLQALAAVLGGTQSLHTNSYDEALALPTEEAAKLALRTQQVIAQESGVTAAVDPLGGSYFVEGLTDEIETRAREYLEHIDTMGGALAAIEKGFQVREIDEAAYRAQRAIEEGDARVVAVNVHVEAHRTSGPTPVFRVDPKSENEQREALRQRKADRDGAVVRAKLAELRGAAAGTEPIMEPILEALRVRGSLGEICQCLREVWGTYRPPGA